jgi:hypothetical protein
MTQYFTKDGENFVEVKDPLHTQSEVDQVVTSRLDRERGKFADYDDLKAKAGTVDTIKADFETKLKDATGKVDSLTKDLGAAKLETDKVKIINEFKLPDDMHEFVTGDTPDDMRKRAEKLAKSIGGGKVNLDKKPKPGKDGKSSDNKELAGKLFGSKSDD